MHALQDSTAPLAPFRLNSSNTNSKCSHPAKALRGDRIEEMLHEKRNHQVNESKEKSKQNARKMQNSGIKCREEKMPKKQREIQTLNNGVMVERWAREMDKRNRCGGCINHHDTFLNNPQVLNIYVQTLLDYTSGMYTYMFLISYTYHTDVQFEYTVTAYLSCSINFTCTSFINYKAPHN